MIYFSDFGAGGGGDPATQDELAALLLGSAKSGLWLPTGDSGLYAEPARTTPVTADSGSSIGSLDDYSGNSNHFQEATNQPVATAGVTFDGTDYLSFSFSGGAGSSDMTFLALLNTTDNSGTIALDLADVEDGFAIFRDSNSLTNLGAGDVYVDGVQYVDGSDTRNALHDAIATGEWKLIEGRNYDLSAWTGVRLAYSASASTQRLSGAIAAIVLIDNSALGGDAATALSTAQTLMAEIEAGL